MVLRSCVRNEHWGQYGYSMRETTSNKRRHGGWRRRGCTQAERQAPPTKLHAIATQLIWTPIKHVPSGCFTPAWSVPSVMARPLEGSDISVLLLRYCGGLWMVACRLGDFRNELRRGAASVYIGAGGKYLLPADPRSERDRHMHRQRYLGLSHSQMPCNLLLHLRPAERDVNADIILGGRRRSLRR